MRPYDYLSNRLAGEMCEGNMHACLRDVGRMAGGLVAAGHLSEADLASLCEIAGSLAINKAQAEAKWAEAVNFGRREPVRWDQHEASRRPDQALDWGDEIGGDYRVVDPNWLEPVEVAEPDEWNPVQQASDYLSMLFASEEYVGFVVESFEKDGRRLPTRGNYSRTAGELLAELSRYKDIGAVFGDVDPDVGAWVRFNPLDGQGVKDANVTDFRFALVESDAMPIEDQRAIYEQLELPIVVMVHSGNKSLHAIVRIEADSLSEYRRRVDLLYEVCEKNGLPIDRQNRNPSRLSRLPGVMRGECRQFIVARSVGKPSWSAWEDWIEAVNDDLPDPEPLVDVWSNLPPLAPPLIDGVLRQGHKMLVSGPSKAGKSFLLIEMCIAIAEGQRWLVWDCTQGRVLYVNLELDRASCLHRFRDVYAAMGLPPNNLANIDIWNLRGKAVPMDRLAPKLIRRSLKKRYSAVVIDPIYKVITGDENAADKMAHFCNQFDRVCHELKAAVIYCHHHSKGYQGQKRSMDRASGSGVFARDPDALLDLIELTVSEELRKRQENDAVCQLVAGELDRRLRGWRDHTSEGDLRSESEMRAIATRMLGDTYTREILPLIFPARQAVSLRSAWRVEGTLREYPRTNSVDLWFRYPRHHVDTVGVLKDCDAHGEEPPWQRAGKTAKAKAGTRKRDRQKKLDDAFGVLQADGDVTIGGLAEYLDVSDRTARDRVKEAGWTVVNGVVLQPTAAEEGF
jgi:regulatory protein RepA